MDNLIFPVTEIELGKTYRDIHTAFQGIAIGTNENVVAGVEVLGGLPLVTLQPVAPLPAPGMSQQWLSPSYAFGIGRLALVPASSEV